jgi:hypothetical protein
MAIFGTAAPKIGSVNIDYAVVEAFEPEFDGIIHKSEISGDKVVINSSRHLNVEIIVNLWKEGNPTTKYNTIRGLLDTEQDFYLHRDGTAVRNAANTANAKFLVKEVTPFYLETAQYRDRLRIVLESMERVSFRT